MWPQGCPRLSACERRLPMPLARVQWHAPMLVFVPMVRLLRLRRRAAGKRQVTLPRCVAAMGLHHAMVWRIGATIRRAEPVSCAQHTQQRAGGRSPANAPCAWCWLGQHRLARRRQPQPAWCLQRAGVRPADELAHVEHAVAVAAPSVVWCARRGESMPLTAGTWSAPTVASEIRGVCGSWASAAMRAHATLFYPSVAHRPAAATKATRGCCM